MKVVLLLMGLLLGAASQAETVYRCGPDGRTYTQTPCAQGRELDVRDARSETQRREGLAVAESQRALGDAMERDRLDREARVAPSAAGHIESHPGGVHPMSEATRPPHPKKKRSKAKARPSADFTAVVPTRKKH